MRNLDATSDPAIAVRSNENFVWLDVARGVSALIVCAGHLRAATFPEFSTLENKSLSLVPFYFVTSLGHQAVVVFFLLSGFLVGGSVLRKSKDFRLKEYAIARISRLYTVLLPALIATMAIDLVIRIYFPGFFNGEFAEHMRSGPTTDAPSSHSAYTLFGNVLFLQTISVPVFGSNGPLWSLANEFWYYVLFPLCYVTLQKQYGSMQRAISGATVCLILYLLPLNIHVGFLVWLMGVFTYYLAKPIIYKPVSAAAVLITLAVFLASIFVEKARLNAINLPSDWIVGVGFGFLCFTLCRFPAPCSNAFFLRTLASFGTKLSNISFSLYLVHFPLVILLSLVLFSNGKLDPYSVSSQIVFLTMLLFLLISGYTFWFVFERHTEKVRTLLRTTFLSQ